MAKIVKKNEISQKIPLADQVALRESKSNLPKSKIIDQQSYQASGKTDEIIQEAKKEATQIKQKARDLLSRVEMEVENSKQKGFNEGKDQGLQESAEFMSRLSAEKQNLINHLEKDVLKLVYDISEKIIGSDLSEREESIIGLIKQGLHNAMGDHFKIMVNPQDLERVKKHKPILMSYLGTGKVIHLQADEKVRPHGCFIQTEMGTIDAELETQLRVIREVLGLDEEEIPKEEVIFDQPQVVDEDEVQSEDQDLQETKDSSEDWFDF